MKTSYDAETIKTAKKMFVEDKKSSNTISKEMNIKHHIVQYWLKKYRWTFDRALYKKD
jgi:hypothetical protein